MEENDHLLLTPFEKNIEVWRQLWRVLERSDMVVQILDSRDPLLFRSVDLEKYVAEFKTRQPYPQEKVMLLMLNKADLLTVEQRKYWADYFTKEGIRFIFFSAYAEQVLLNEELKEEKAKQLEESTAAIRRNAQNIFSTLAEDSDSDDDDEEDDKEDEAEDEKTKEEEQKEEVTEKPITEVRPQTRFPRSLVLTLSRVFF
jgi:large subunit GTPase 1